MATKKSKTIVTPGTKVKQDMIDFIKTQGMTRALKRAGEINAKGTKGEAEFIEGVRRMYGARRLETATKTAMPKAPLKKGSYQAGSAKSGKATYTTGSGVRNTAVGKSTTKPTTKVIPAKKDNTKSNLLKGVAGTVAAGAVLVASRGKAGGLAAKLSPGLAKSGVGRAVLGGTNQAARKVSNARMMASDKALSASGRAAAAAKRPVSQSQYDAMKAAAKKGVSTSTKMTTKKKVVLSGAGAGGVTTGKKN